MVVWKIYAMLEPDSKEIRYVGRSYQLEYRMQSHISSAKKYTNKKKTDVQGWILSLLEQNKKPEFIILQDNIPWALGDVWEQAWIRGFYERGITLLNREHKNWTKRENLEKPIESAFSYRWRKTA